MLYSSTLSDYSSEKDKNIIDAGDPANDALIDRLLND